MNELSAVVGVREPLQARSQATLARLLDATEELLESHPFDDLSVQEICKQARSSVGAFYTRFEDKTSLLHVLHERLCAETRAAAEAAFAPARWQARPIGEVMGAVVSFAVEAHRLRRGVRREVGRRNGFDDRFRARSVDASAHVARCLAALLKSRRSDITVADVDVAADMALRVLFAVLENPVFGTGVTPESLTGELTAVLVGYLGVRSV